uniref:Uncharacterized protein n=1 Tax=Arundo donax TaxID=35708 RepID=A0A0A9CW37_ARUDO
MSNKSEGLSNDQLCKNQGGALPFIPSSRKNVASSSHSVPTIQGTGSGFKSRDSSSGGKLPPHGSRRLIFLAAPLRGEFVIEKPSFNVSKSKIQHYNAICRLSGSQWQT